MKIIPFKPHRWSKTLISEKRAYRIYVDFASGKDSSVRRVYDNKHGVFLYEKDIYREKKW